MRIDKEQRLFFGCKIDSKLREALAQATPGDRHYFEDPDSPYLRVCTFEDEKWIGKVIDPGLAVTDVEDIQRNVISILRRIAPNVRHNPSVIKIFCIDQRPEPEPAPAPPMSQGGGGGPYIAR